MFFTNVEFADIFHHQNFAMFSSANVLRYTVY